jgi:hypothetical protein
VKTSMKGWTRMFSWAGRCLKGWCLKGYENILQYSKIFNQTFIFNNSIKHLAT